MYTLVCPCIFGLEKIVSFELRRVGATDIVADNGKVTARGDALTVAKANLGLRCAERVLIQLAQFPATSFEDLFQGTYAIDWASIIPQTGAFPVKGWSLGSQLASIPDCQSIIKKAAVEKLKAAYGISWFSETGEKYQIQFSIFKDQVSILLDTSGDGLHKRGYRRRQGAAPIKETLAAGIIDLARVRPGDTVYDPLCGSGTILIEAAMRAMNIAPGLQRSFAAEQWTTFPKKAFADARRQALDAIDRSAAFEGIGFDIDPQAAQLTAENAKLAGVDSRITVQVQDITRHKLKDAHGILITNPPYGERLLTPAQCSRIHQALGAMCHHNDLKSYIITSSDRFEEEFGKKADRRRKLYNGELKCQLYMYFK